MSDSFTDEEEINANVVIDNGSWMIKAGFAGDALPRAIFPSVVGRPKCSSNLLHIPDINEPRVGHEAIKKRGILRLSYPIECRRITDFDDMERVWHHTFYHELKVAPEEHGVLLTDSPLNSMVSREKTTQIMFETFDVPSLCIINQAVASLHACGRTSGAVVETGDSVIDIMAISNGLFMKDSIRRCNFGGRDISNFLRRISCERGYSFSTTSEIEGIRRAKEELSYIALDFDIELECSKTSSACEKSYFDTPNHDMQFTYGNERFRCCELLFRPEICGLDEEGIHQELYKSIRQCEENLHKDLYNNIILSGGSALIPGFGERLLKELKHLAPANTEVKIVTPPERNYLSWKGGSMIASDESSFHKVCLTKDEYEEFGPTLIDKVF